MITTEILNKTFQNNCSLILTISHTLTINNSPTVISFLYRAYLDYNNIKLNLNKLALPPSLQPSLEKIGKRESIEFFCSHGKIVFEKIEVVGCCNGLVLISSGLHNVGISNPAMDRFKVITSINYPGFYSENHGQGYKTNYETPPFYRIYYRKYVYRYFKFRVFGFGYDCNSQCYKIVYLTPLKAHIYCLKKDCHSWRRIDLPEFKSSSGFIQQGNSEKGLYIKAYNHGVFTNNHIHWNITKNDPLVFEYSKEKILGFDLCKEEWGEVPVPEVLNRGYFLQGYMLKPYLLEVGVLNGSLCILLSRGISYPHLELWIMKKYAVKESWMKLCNVPNGSGIPLAYYIEQDEYLLPGKEHGLGWYNPQKNRVNKVEFHGCEFTGEHYYSTGAKMCIESFADPFTSIE